MAMKEYSPFPTSSRTGVSSSDGLGRSYPFAEMQSAYSTAPADQAGVVADTPI